MSSAFSKVKKLDVVIASVLSVLGLLLMNENIYGGLADERADPTSDAHAVIDVGGIVPVELAFPLFLLTTVPLLWRRAYPLAAVGASVAGLIVNELLLGTDLLRCGVLLPVTWLYAFTAGSRLEGRESFYGLGLALMIPLIDITTSFGAGVLIVAVAITTATWGVGRVVRSRTELAGELEARTADLRDARDERARVEVATDRARLSLELDELLQRRLGDLARLAEAGSRPGDPAGAQEKLADIERESRRTLDDMRSLVGVLRGDSAELPTAPQPTLTHLEALLVRAKGAGAQLTVEGNPRVLPAAVELSAYRIVEQLLAAFADAPGVEVCVRFRADALELAVAGPAGREAKAPIARARERVRLERGTLEATVRGGRAEAVVSLPVLTAV